MLRLQREPTLACPNQVSGQCHNDSCRDSKCGFQHAAGYRPRHPQVAGKQKIRQPSWYMIHHDWGKETQIASSRWRGRSRTVDAQRMCSWHIRLYLRIAGIVIQSVARWFIDLGKWQTIVMMACRFDPRVGSCAAKCVSFGAWQALRQDDRSFERITVRPAIPRWFTPLGFRRSPRPCLLPRTRVPGR